MIFLHGLGDSAEGFLDAFSYQHWVPQNCRVILPTAPNVPVTMNNEFKMNSWFDILKIGETKKKEDRHSFN